MTHLTNCTPAYKFPIAKRRCEEWWHLVAKAGIPVRGKRPLAPLAPLGSWPGDRIRGGAGPPNKTTAGGHLPERRRCYRGAASGMSGEASLSRSAASVAAARSGRWPPPGGSYMEQRRGETTQTAPLLRRVTDGRKLQLTPTP